MNISNLSILIAIALINGQVLGLHNTPDNVTSRLQVQVPKSLFKEKGYDHREALFGSPPYGASIAQNVYYTDTDLCDPAGVNPNSGYPPRDKDENGKMLPWSSPFILMANRGNCSFVQKARNAQHAGAAGLLIADNICLCSDSKCLNMDDSSFVPCQDNEPIMADDGSGGDITIPTFLLFKSDAADIIKVLKDDKMPVQVEMSWSLPHPDSKVNYELWTVPSDTVSKDFQQSWKDIAVKMKDKLYFTPHQYIYDGIKSRCQTGDGRNMCFNLCTNNGRYCATDPDNDLEHGTTGAEVVTEALRRICIWKYYGEADGLGMIYWDYIAEFIKRCDTPDFFANEECVKDAFKHSKIDYKRIDQCMNDSGGLTDNAANTLLDREIEAANRRGVVVLPTMFVNSAPLRGALTTNTVFNAICAGFSENTEPSICSTCRGCGDVAQCVSSGQCKSFVGPSQSGGVSKRTFGTTLLFMSMAFGAAGYLHWRKTRDDMREQVRGILAEYMPLEGGDDEDHSPMDFAKRGMSASLIT